MNAPLLRLSARRAAPLPALAVVVGVTLLAVVDPPGRAEIVEVSPTFEEVIRGGTRARRAHRLDRRPPGGVRPRSALRRARP